MFYIDGGSSPINMVSACKPSQMSGVGVCRCRSSDEGMAVFQLGQPASHPVSLFRGQVEANENLLDLLNCSHAVCGQLPAEMACCWKTLVPPRYRRVWRSGKMSSSSDSHLVGGWWAAGLSSGQKTGTWHGSRLLTCCGAVVGDAKLDTSFAQKYHVSAMRTRSSRTRVSVPMLQTGIHKPPIPEIYCFRPVRLPAALLMIPMHSMPRPVSAASSTACFSCSACAWTGRH